MDSKILLIGFSGEHSSPIGEVPLEITIGNSPNLRTETLNFVVVRAIKFYTPRGFGTVFSTYEPDKVGEGSKRLRETSTEVTKGVLSCTNAEEKIISNDKYPEQMVIIEKQLPTKFKEKLRDLLRSNVDVFAWTHTDMTGIPRTIIMGGKPFNPEHKLNEYNHIKPVKQKKRGLGPDRSKASCKEVEELIKAGILQKHFEEDMLKDIQETFDRKKTIQWIADAEEAFQKMKKFMEILPTLTALIKGEVLVIYLTASAESISAVLLIRRKEREVLIYFISRVLQGAELNYPALEKLILALVHAARRL
ncbi:reverse transcriptase domain-containing protein [Tanacetum coccineum]